MLGVAFTFIVHHVKTWCQPENTDSLASLYMTLKNIWVHVDNIYKPQTYNQVGAKYIRTIGRVLWNKYSGTNIGKWNMQTYLKT
jgi:hypothetical protein